ncbi:MAG: hypothetical protein AAFV80_07000 [Bacteroidota bacterium]
MVQLSRPYQMIACFLVVLISFSSLGLTVQTHYCMGRLKSVSLFGKAKACFQSTTTKTCLAKKNACPLDKIQKQRRGCCDDHLIVMDADLDLIPLQSVEGSPIDHHFLLAFAWSSFTLSDSYTTTLPYQNYKPPLLDRDVCVLVQSLLL